MTIQHVNIPDGKRHEPKGISTAALGEVYVANGAGGGTWDNILADVNNANLIPIYVSITDISTPGSVWVVNPIAGDIYKIYVVLDGTIATANSIVTAEINGVLVSGSAVTCTAAGSTAGSVFSATPSGTNTVGAGGVIEIITDGGSSNTVRANVTILMDVS